MGYPSTIILLQAAVIPFTIIGSGVTVDGLTITSDNPYAVEFIQLGGTNHTVKTIPYSVLRKQVPLQVGL